MNFSVAAVDSRHHFFRFSPFPMYHTTGCEFRNTSVDEIIVKGGKSQSSGVFFRFKRLWLYFLNDGIGKTTILNNALPMELLLYD